MNDVETKKAVIAHLEKAFTLADSCVSGIQYFDESNVVRIRGTDGTSACVDAEGEHIVFLLGATLRKLEPYLWPNSAKEKRFLNISFREIFGRFSRGNRYD